MYVHICIHQYYISIYTSMYVCLYMCVYQYMQTAIYNICICLNTHIYTLNNKCALRNSENYFIQVLTYIK